MLNHSQLPKLLTKLKGGLSPRIGSPERLTRFVLQDKSTNSGGAIRGFFHLERGNGKASTRRKKRRQEYLESLARENPKLFQSEWAKRLESWTEKAGHSASRLTDRDGNRVAAAFTLVEKSSKGILGKTEQGIYP